jgi:hypothetical protein
MNNERMLKEPIFSYFTLLINSVTEIRPVEETKEKL